MNKDEFIKEIEKLNMFCEEKDNFLYVKSFNHGAEVVIINLNYKLSYDTNTREFSYLHFEDKIKIIELLNKFTASIEPSDEKYYYVAKSRFGEQENFYLAYDYDTQRFECVEYPEEKDNIKFYFSDKDIEDLRGDISRIKHDYFKMKNGKSIVD